MNRFITCISLGDIGNAKINLSQSNNVDDESDAVTIDIQEAVSLNFALRYNLEGLELYSTFKGAAYNALVVYKVIVSMKNLRKNAENLSFELLSFSFFLES